MAKNTKAKAGGKKKKPAAKKKFTEKTISVLWKQDRVGNRWRPVTLGLLKNATKVTPDDLNVKYKATRDRYGDLIVVSRTPAEAAREIGSVKFGNDADEYCDDPLHILGLTKADVPDGMYVLEVKMKKLTTELDGEKPKTPKKAKAKK